MRVLCGCGADLSQAPSKASWDLSGIWCEYRDCPNCSSTKSYCLGLAEGIAGLPLKVERPNGSFNLNQRSLMGVLETFLLTDDAGNWIASMPVGSKIWAIGDGERHLVAEVTRTKVWLCIAPP